MLLKVLPSLGLITGALLGVLLGPEIASTLVPQVQGSARLSTVLVFPLQWVMTLGGFAVRQYNGYKNKRLKFLQQVAETLFSNNLVPNQGVLHTLVDAAAEEECKELILVAYQLLTARQPLTSAQLDAAIKH